MSRRSKQSAGPRRYHAALRAIRAKHPTASHRDAQAVYRQLRKLTDTPVTARQVSTARSSTTRRMLTRARDLGSRTTPRTKAERAKQARLARQFNRDNARSERRGKKEKIGRGKKSAGGSGSKTKTRGRTSRVVEDESGGAPDGPTRGRETFDDGAAVDVDDPEEYARLYDESDPEDFDDVEIETSPDYAGE